jgi:energy-coupling factor transporter ATP-binding protein EcfA2
MGQETLFKNDLVKLSSSFNRSTNLELDFEDKSRLKDIFISHKFESALSEVLETVNSDSSNQRVRVLSGSPGLGKSTFALLLSNLVSRENQTLITRKVNSHSDEKKTKLKDAYSTFNKSGKSLMPVFLNGYMGNIEDAFLSQLKKAFEYFLEGGEELFQGIVEESSKNQWNVIQKWNKSYPEIYENFVALVEKEGEEFPKFEKKLKKGSSEAIEIFSRIYSEVTGGASADLASNVVTIFKKAIKTAQAAGFSGIFVIYDEFGKYLEKGVHTPSALNVQFLQDFAEYCDRSGESQCHLTLITHMSVSQYASQLPINIQNEWAKIEGRFQETAFYDRGTNYYKMISHVFESPVKDNDFEVYKKAQKKSQEFVKNFKANSEGFDDLLETEDLPEVLATCYPLHPVTLAFTPYLSQKVAQNERTLYTFLTRDEDYSLKRFLDTNISSEDLAELMPSYLYKYFAPLISKDLGVGGAYRINLLMDEALAQVEKGDDLSTEVLSIIALASVVKNNSFAPLTLNFISVCLHGHWPKEEVKKSLEKLRRKKVVFYNKILKQYELQQGSSVDIQEEIDSLKNNRLTSKDLVKIVTDYYPQDFLVPKRYNFKHSITRFYRIGILSIEELKSGRYIQSPDYNKEDGLLYYVIPFSQDELELARNLISEKKDTLVVYAPPKKFIECQKDIEELNAINALYNNKEIINSSPLVKKELDKHKSITLNSIYAILDNVIGKFSLGLEVFYPKHSVNSRIGISHYSELQRALGDIFESEYTRSVVFNSELINKHKVAAAITLARKTLADKMIQNPELDQKVFGIEGNGPEVALYKSLKRVSGFKYNTKTKRFSISPKCTQAHRLLEDYKEILRSNSRGISYKDFIDTLISPPFGLRKGLIPLFMALFDRCLEFPVNHYFDGEYITHLDGSHYDLLMKHPKIGKIQYVEVSKSKAAYLNELAEVFDVQEEVSVTSVVAGLYRWRKEVPDYTKHSEHSSVEGKKFLIYIDSAKEPDKLIFEKIPEAFGFKPIELKTSIDESKLLASKVKNETGQIVKVYQDLVKRMHSALVENLYFFQESCLAEKRVTVSKGSNLALLYQQTWKKFHPEVRSHSFNKKTSAFINRFATFDTTKHTFFFVETLADVLTDCHPRHWGKEGESLFSYALSRCQNEIEMVCEFLSSDFKGESAVAFINYDSGERQYLRLGVKTGLNSKQLEIKSEVEGLLHKLNVKDRNNLLIELLGKEEERKTNVSSRLDLSDYVE